MAMFAFSTSRFLRPSDPVLPPPPLHWQSQAHGEEALAALHGPVDVVFTDYLMEPMDGMALTRRIRDEATSPKPFVPVIMVTGLATPETVGGAREAAAGQSCSAPNHPGPAQACREH